MKKIILVAASVLFTIAGFSQTAESTTKSDAKPHCDKASPSCCAHAGAKKDCDKSTASVAPDEAQPTVAAPISATNEAAATKPKNEKATRKSNAAK